MSELLIVPLSFGLVSPTGTLSLLFHSNVFCPSRVRNTSLPVMGSMPNERTVNRVVVEYPSCSTGSGAPFEASWRSLIFCR